MRGRAPQGGAAGPGVLRRAGASSAATAAALLLGACAAGGGDGEWVAQSREEADGFVWQHRP